MLCIILHTVTYCTPRCIEGAIEQESRKHWLLANHVLAMALKFRCIKHFCIKKNIVYLLNRSHWISSSQFTILESFGVGGENQCSMLCSDSTNKIIPQSDYQPKKSQLDLISRYWSTPAEHHLRTQWRTISTLQWWHSPAMSPWQQHLTTRSRVDLVCQTAGMMLPGSSLAPSSFLPCSQVGSLSWSTKVRTVPLYQMHHRYCTFRFRLAWGWHGSPKEWSQHYDQEFGGCCFRGTLILDFRLWLQLWHRKRNKPILWHWALVCDQLRWWEDGAHLLWLHLPAFVYHHCHHHCFWGNGWENQAKCLHHLLFLQHSGVLLPCSLGVGWEWHPVEVWRDRHCRIWGCPHVGWSICSCCCLPPRTKNRTLRWNSAQDGASK